jgi:hypothetical protein
MYSRHHAAISAVVGLALAAADVTSLAAVWLVAGAVLLGVFVDLDHFLIARLRTGSWEPLVRCLRNPRLALLDQDDIFATGAVGVWTRLVSHIVITVVLVAGLSVVDPALAVAAAAVLVAHILSDVVWDAWGGALG